MQSCQATSDSDILTALALATTSANSGFKIYEARFLFSAENVNSVRHLILDALVSHSNSAMHMADADLNFGQATSG